MYTQFVEIGMSACLVPAATEKQSSSYTPKQKNTDAEKKQPAKIMIVEDERLVAENLKDIVEENEYEVVAVVTSGEEAIKRFDRAGPDLILMDIRLKGVIDGIQTALVIQQTMKAVPILFLTAYPEDQFPHLDAVNPALFLYLTKPYAQRSLLKAIQSLLK